MQTGTVALIIPYTEPIFVAFMLRRYRQLPKRTVDIVEVSPRDGLQGESATIATADKIELINRAVAAGVRRIEATSFVNPKRVPQMADAEEVMAGLPRPDGVSYIGLALNRRGFERALEAGCHEVNFVVVASETFNQRNQGTSVEETLATWNEVAALAHEAGTPCGVTISAAFGCPYEGEVPSEHVAEIARRVTDAGPSEIALADTIGVGVPTQVHERVAAVAEAAPGIPLRCHFHNTRNTGLANAQAAIETGVGALDASIGGIGGCPFAPAATGNIPTEDLVYMLDRSGVETGIDIEAVIDTAAWLAERLGHEVPALLGRAGIFPPAEVRT